MRYKECLVTEHSFIVYARKEHVWGGLATLCLHLHVHLLHPVYLGGSLVTAACEGALVEVLLCLSCRDEKEVL